jgi:hypothetical protein
MMNGLSMFELGLSFIITWTIGLLPPLLIRYAYLKSPLDKKFAMWVVFLFWIFNTFLFIALGSQNKSHLVLAVIAYVSFRILRADNKNLILTKQPMADAQLEDTQSEVAEPLALPDSESNKAPQQTEPIPATEYSEQASAAPKRINWQKGAFRLWLVFTICWGGYFSWAAYDSNQSIKTWVAIIEAKREFYYEMVKYEELAPVFHAGGLDKAYYRGMVNSVANDLIKYDSYMSEEADRLYNAQVWGPAAPVALLLIWFIGGWIRKGLESNE